MPRISAPRAPATGRISSAFEGMSAELDRQLARAAHRALRPGDLGARREAELGDALEPFLQRNRDLHAGEIRADAAMDAEAERDVTILGPVDHHTVGIREHRGIAI